MPLRNFFHKEKPLTRGDNPWERFQQEAAERERDPAAEQAKRLHDHQLKEQAKQLAREQRQEEDKDKIEDRLHDRKVKEWDRAREQREHRQRMRQQGKEFGHADHLGYDPLSDVKLVKHAVGHEVRKRMPGTRWEGKE
ncbi:MAG: hypothetical protein Q9168_003885 [Polycauliona sp. 1 TL-2023]